MRRRSTVVAWQEVSLDSLDDDARAAASTGITCEVRPLDAAGSVRVTGSCPRCRHEFTCDWPLEVLEAGPRPAPIRPIVPASHVDLLGRPAYAWAPAAPAPARPMAPTTPAGPAAPAAPDRAPESAPPGPATVLSPASPATPAPRAVIADVLVTCRCGQAHKGRAEDAIEGCGLTWIVDADASDSGPRPPVAVRPATTAERAAGLRVLAAAAGQEALVTTSAAAWHTGLGAFLTLATGATTLGMRATLRALEPTWAWVIGALAVAAFLVAAAATALSLTVTAGDAYRNSTAGALQAGDPGPFRAARLRRIFHRARAGAGAAVAVWLVAVVLSWAAPAAQSPPEVARALAGLSGPVSITAGKDVTACGDTEVVDGAVLVTGGDATVRRFPLGEVTTWQPATECPAPAAPSATLAGWAGEFTGRTAVVTGGAREVCGAITFTDPAFTVTDTAGTAHVVPLEELTSIREVTSCP